MHYDQDELAKAHEQDEVMIGRAFRQLVEGLPANLLNFTHLFARCQTTPTYEQRQFSIYPDVQEAGNAALPFVRYGLTPLRVMYVTQAPVALAKRLMQHGSMPRSPACLFTAQSSADFLINSQAHLRVAPVLPLDMLEREIVGVARCKPAVADALFYWLIEVSRLRPWLFQDGFAESIPSATKNWGEAAPDAPARSLASAAGIVKITLEPEIIPANLADRWTLPRQQS